MAVLINEIELASELASRQLEARYHPLVELYDVDDEGVLTYKEEYQDEFNDLYDYYLELIDTTKEIGSTKDWVVCGYCKGEPVPDEDKDTCACPTCDGAGGYYANPVPHITIKWTINDVLDMCDENNDFYNLTKEDAIEILRIVDREHDADVGVNWNVIRDVTERYIEENNL